MISHSPCLSFALPPLMPHRPLGLPMRVLRRPSLNFPSSFLSPPRHFLPVMGVVGLRMSSMPKWSATHTWGRRNRMGTLRVPTATAATTMTTGATVPSVMGCASESPAPRSATSTHPATQTSGTFLEPMVGLGVGYGHLVGL